MTRTAQVRVACLGAGYFSQFHRGSRGRMPDATPVAAADRDIDRAHATGLPAYHDLSEMLVATAPDRLDIILPPLGHAEAIRTALQHGVRWIICPRRDRGGRGRGRHPGDPREFPGQPTARAS